jgi:hypothetical protein
VAEGLTHAIGEALLELVELVWPAAAPHVERVARQVAEAVRPDPPFTVTTQDGEVLTGIVVLDHGRAVFFFGSRNVGAPKPAHQAPAYQAPERSYPERGYPERNYDADQSPLWSPRPYTR